MRRQLSLVVVGLLICTGRLPAMEIEAAIKKIDADKGTIVIFTKGKDYTLTIAKDIKVLGADGKPLADGVKSKELKEGVAATVDYSRGSGGGVLNQIRLGKEQKSEQAAITRPDVSEKACPIALVEIDVPNAPKTVAAIRKPPGKGPFPAIVHLHGGLETWPKNRLTADVASQTLSRFLAAGYVVAAPTFRPRSNDPQTNDALMDCLAVIDYVKKMPEVDPKSVVVWGDSGGGSLVLEIAGETSVAAVLAQEPATVLFSGMFTKESLGGKPPFTSSSGSAHAIMADPKKYYTPELQKFTRAKIKKIGCPVFIAYGNVSKINKINTDIIIPELKDAGKTLEAILYPNEPHGFSKGTGTPQAALKFYTDGTTFVEKYLPTKPKPIDKELVKAVPVASKKEK